LAAVSLVLALLVGIGAGWWTRPHSPAPTVELPIEDGPKAADRIEELYTQITSAAPHSAQEKKQGLKLRIELSVEYLKSKKLDAADQFFRELDGPDQPPPYHTLAKLGHAMVLAFKDRALESNNAFKMVLFANKGDGWSKNKDWINSGPALRELIAQSLDYNFANAPGDFPPNLHWLRHPPRAGLKNSGNKSK
jgi:hypothetical protein